MKAASQLYVSKWILYALKMREISLVKKYQIIAATILLLLLGGWIVSRNDISQYPMYDTIEEAESIEVSAELKLRYKILLDLVDGTGNYSMLDGTGIEYKDGEYIIPPECYRYKTNIRDEEQSKKLIEEDIEAEQEFEEE